MTAILLLPLILGTEPLVPTEINAQARQLVAKLGNWSFRVRENAAKELQKFRYDAFPALIDGLKDTDSERVSRCRRLLPVIEWWKNPKLLQFVLKAESAPPRDLPELDQFFQLTGDSRESRELYAEMVTIHAPYLGSSVADPDLMEDIFVAHRQQTLTTRTAHWSLRFDPEFFETRAGATLYFFLTSDARYDDRYQLARLERTPLGNAHLGEHLLASPPLRKLFFDWVLRERNWFLKRSAMEIAMRAKIEEALPVLPLLLGSARNESEVRDCAEMLLLARDYPLEQLRPTLRSLVDSGKVVSKGVSIADVSFGVLLLADGKSLAENGYRASDPKQLSVDTFRVRDLESREKALRAWLNPMK